MSAALVDLIVVFAGYLATYFGVRAVGLPSPGACAVVVAVLLSTWRLSAASQSWSSVGLRKPSRWLATAGAVLALYLITVACVVGLVTPLANALGWHATNVSSLGNLSADKAALARLLVLAWTTAAVGEELLFRGFLLDRLRQLFGTGPFYTACCVILQAALFGIAHFYLGARGMATAATVGLVFGTWFVVRSRNLWPLIVAHGLTDTVSLLAIHMGVVPS